MDEIFSISEERKKELDKIFEQEISNLKNNIISREEFISYIRLQKISFCDFIYLVNTYVGLIKVIDKNRELLNNLKLIDDNLNFIKECDIEYDIPKKNNIPKIRDTKKIRKYENMALNGKKVKKRKK